MTPAPIDPAAAALLFLSEISTEAWGRNLPTVRLANLIGGVESALDEPVTPPGTSGSAEVDAMRAAHAHVLTCAHVYAAAMQAEQVARTKYKAARRAPGAPTMKVHQLHLAMLAAEDTATEARGALIRAVRELPESKFDIVGAP